MCVGVDVDSSSVCGRKYVIACKRITFSNTSSRSRVIYLSDRNVSIDGIVYLFHNLWTFQNIQSIVNYYKLP